MPARSYAEKVSSIFGRATGLMRAKALDWKDRPLWYDIYAAFPPHQEPRWDRKPPADTGPPREILYPEDIIRARFYREFGSPGKINMANEASRAPIQQFVDMYVELQNEYPGKDEDELFTMTETRLATDRGAKLRRTSTIAANKNENTL